MITLRNDRSANSRHTRPSQRMSPQGPAVRHGRRR